MHFTISLNPLTNQTAAFAEKLNAAPAVSLTSTLQNILSKPVAVFPDNYCHNVQQ